LFFFEACFMVAKMFMQDVGLTRIAAQDNVANKTRTLTRL
jgi:hypothetical protein